MHKTLTIKIQFKCNQMNQIPLIIGKQSAAQQFNYSLKS